MINKIFISIVSAILSVSISAETDPYHPPITFGDKEGENIFITAIDLGWGSKRVNVKLSEPVPVDDEKLFCGYGGLQIQADESQSNIDQILSVSLAAYLSNKPVRVVVSQENCALGERYKMIAIGM